MIMVASAHRYLEKVNQKNITSQCEGFVTHVGSY
jgi:hypothetical protein